MVLQDELSLRDEINQIADRIDTIIHTINQVYPMEPDSTAENTKETGPQDH